MEVIASLIYTDDDDDTDLHIDKHDGFDDDHGKILVIVIITLIITFFIKIIPEQG